ncbi:ABC transporter permease [Clostridium perfringens]|nr:ABC transporter permease [Clostridium perfringens]
MSMKSYLGVSIKQIRRQKLSSIFIIITIILSTMLLTSIGQSSGIIKNLITNQSRWINGDRHASINFISKELAQNIKENELIDNVGITNTFGESKIPNSSFILQLDRYDEKALNIFKTKTTLISGDYPKSQNEVALSEDTLEMLGLEKNLNQRINLPVKIYMNNDEIINKEFILTGITKNNSIGYLSGRISGIVGNEITNDLNQNDNNYSVSFKVKNLENFNYVINTFRNDLNLEDNQIQYNDMYLNNLGVNIEGTKANNKELNISFIIIGLLIIIAAGFAVYNIFSIAISKEVKQFGIFRAIGATSTQLYKIVMTKIISLLILSIPIGVFLGILFSEFITKSIVALFNPNIFMLDTKEQVINLISTNSNLYINYIIISVIVVIVFSLLAAMPSAKAAAKTSPKIAIDGNKKYEVKRKKRINKNLNKIKNIEVYLARLNLNRNKGRSLVSILSMFISIVVFIALNSFLSNLDISKKYISEEKGDFSLTSYKYSSGFDSEHINKISDLKHVENIMYIKNSNYNQDQIPNDINFEMDNSSLNIEGINDEYFQKRFPDLTSEEIEMFINGTGCLIGEPTEFIPEGFKNTIINKNQMITVNNKKLKVIKVVSGLDINNSLGSVEIIVNENIYEEITGDNDVKQAYIEARNGANLQKLEQEIKLLISSNPDLSIISYEKLKSESVESFKQISFLAICFIIFINIISFINVFNTMYVNIQTRLREIGIQEAIGISKKSLYRIFLFEGLYKASIASIFGVIVGSIISILLNMATSKTNIFNISIGAVFISILITFLICIISSIFSLYKIKNISIIENIRNI